MIWVRNMSGPIFTIANQLTLLRLALTPVLVVLIVSHQLNWALVVFVVAGVTDLLDGLIARRGHQLTKLGAMLDPVADKLLLGSCYVALTWTSGLHLHIPAWLTIVALSRDATIIVVVAVVHLTMGHRSFPPSMLGKLTTVSQVATAGIVLLLNCVGEAPRVVEYIFDVTAVLTVASALHYVYAASAHGGTEAAS
jgi:cardiolipin synthase (CMP-forming)